MKFSLLAVCAALFFASLSQANTPVWIDTDPSVARGGHEVDDGLALLQAFRSSALSIRGISAVFGNAPLDQAFPIGQHLVRDFGPAGMKVHRGAASAQDLGRETEASRALEAALEHEELTVIAIGPVTNLGTVVKNHPELAKRITKVIAVAGRRPHQRFSAQPSAKPFRDFNFEMDAPAFQAILDSKVPLVLTPWEISSKVWLGEKDLASLRTNNPSGSWVWDAAEDWLKFWRQNLGTAGFNPFDTLAVGYAADPDGFQCEQLPVAIERLPDDVDAKNPEKPYLMADRHLRSASSALYCYEAPTGFAAALVQRIGHFPALDHSAWNELTGKYVNAEARVDYRALKERDLPRLDAYLQQLAGKWPEGLPQPEQKAALINAYNALTVRWILANYPVESIWRTKHPFTEPRHTLNDEKISLDGIEGRLRAMGDPRVHAALVCASRSCPPLRWEAYSAQHLGEQLDDNFRRWLANRELNEFLPQRRTALVSMIFKWYAGDFGKTGGSVEKYLIRFGPQGQAQFLAMPGSCIDYKTYNWGLNDALTLGSNYSQAKFYWDALRNK